MSKRIIALIGLFCLLISLAGCKLSIRNTVEGKDASLPAFDLSTSLICTVDSMDGSRCTVTVLEDNSNYDKDDVLYITYDTVAEGQSLTIGDVITFSYNYVSDVSAISGTPHIVVEELSILPEYTPPETTTEATDELAE